MNNNNKRKQKQRNAQAAAFNAVTRELQALRAEAKANRGNAKPSRRRKAKVRGGGPMGLPMNMPAGFGASRTGRKPRIRVEGDKVIFAHVEMASNIINSASFTIGGQLSINIGHSSLFPVGARFAKIFESYRFRRLVFRYVPSCGTGQTGQICVAIDPKSSDGAPATMRLIAGYPARVLGPQWECMEFAVPKDVLHNMGPRKYVTTTEVSDEDSNLYNVGTLWIATENSSPAGIICGSVEVDYEVELVSISAQENGVDQSCVVISNGGTETISLPWGLTGTQVAQGFLYDEVVGNALSLKNCDHNVSFNTRYQFWFRIQGTGLTNAAVSYLGATGVNSVVVANGAGTVLMGWFSFQPLVPKPVLTLTLTGTTVTDTWSSVCRLPDGSSI